MEQPFTPTRAAALEQLSAFLPHAGRDYAARRNYDLGPGRHTHVSRLSPYLRCRLITEEEVLQAVTARHSVSAAEKFIQEVFWRTYWKGWLEQRPSVWAQYLNGLDQAWDNVQTQAGLRAQWESACYGTTGIECFDAWAQELVETGYLHNHARMWFASIWIFTLELPWELGADFFLRHLLDGDPASNTLGWRWVAGIQTQGKTYLARTSNISKYTEGRFHPKWQLASSAFPRPAPPPAPLTSLPVSDVVDSTAVTGVILHEDDLSPAFSMGSVSPVACAVLQPQKTPGPLLTAPHVTTFRSAALEDASHRWRGRFGPITVVSNAAELASWSRDNALEQIITPYAPVGAVATLIASAQETTDIAPVRQQIRPYDAAAWPFATRGFFPFKKNIPALLDQLKSHRAA